jgi:hypothetical protein
MILEQTDNYIKACMKAWLMCESCIHSENNKVNPRQSLIDKCRTCANSCFTVVCRILNNSEIVQESALVCVLNCRECCDECDEYSHMAYSNLADIEYCSEVCRLCGDVLRSLIVPVHLN